MNRKSLWPIRDMSISRHLHALTGLREKIRTGILRGNKTIIEAEEDLSVLYEVPGPNPNANLPS